MKKDSYVTIKPFMVSELNLKGNELIIYAIIYGFSQDFESDFHGGLQYLCEWTNSTKQGVLKSLNSLIEKHLIDKKEVFENGVKYCRYSVIDTDEVVNKVEQGGKQSLMGWSTKFNGGGKQSLPNNKYNNKDIRNIIYSTESKRLADILYEECKKVNPNFKRTDKQIEQWANDIDKLNRIDNYSWEVIESVLRWAKNDNFWCNNIQSGVKFREKFEQLYPKSMMSNNKNKTYTSRYDNAGMHVDKNHDYSQDGGKVDKNGMIGF